MFYSVCSILCVLYCVLYSVCSRVYVLQCVFYSVCFIVCVLQCVFYCECSLVPKNINNICKHNMYECTPITSSIRL